MSKNTLTMLKEKFENGETGEEVEGVTIIIDGIIKEIFDSIMEKSREYNDYTEILRDSIFEGVNNIITRAR